MFATDPAPPPLDHELDAAAVGVPVPPAEPAPLVATIQEESAIPAPPAFVVAVPPRP